MSTSLNSIDAQIGLFALALTLIFKKKWKIYDFFSFGWVSRECSQQNFGTVVTPPPPTEGAAGTLHRDSIRHPQPWDTPPQSTTKCRKLREVKQVRSFVRGSLAGTQQGKGARGCSPPFVDPAPPHPRATPGCDRSKKVLWVAAKRLCSCGAVRGTLSSYLPARPDQGLVGQNSHFGHPPPVKDGLCAPQRALKGHSRAGVGWVSGR